MAAAPMSWPGSPPTSDSRDRAPRRHRDPTHAFADVALSQAHDIEGRDHAGVVILNPRRFPQGVATGGVLVCSLETFLSQQPPNPSFIHCLQ